MPKENPNLKDFNKDIRDMNEKIAEIAKVVKLESCPKCGGNMKTKTLIVNRFQRKTIRQCELCKFYVDIT